MINLGGRVRVRIPVDVSVKWIIILLGLGLVWAYSGRIVRFRKPLSPTNTNWLMCDGCNIEHIIIRFHASVRYPGYSSDLPHFTIDQYTGQSAGSV